MNRSSQDGMDITESHEIVPNYLDDRHMNERIKKDSEFSTKNRHLHWNLQQLRLMEFCIGYLKKQNTLPSIIF